MKRHWTRFRTRCWAFCAALTAAFCAAAAADDLPHDDSLVLYLGFEEGNGDTTADSSANQYEAQLLGDYDWTNGRFGSGIEFEAGRAVVTDDDKLDVEQLTVMAWVVPTDIWGDQTCHNWGDIIYHKSGASDDSVEFALLGGDGACLYLNSGPGGDDRMGPFNGADADNILTLPDLGIAENEWVHMAATFDGVKMAIYVDGVEAGSRNIAGDNPSIIFNDNHSEVGGRTHNSSYFNGTLDEFALFNRALAENEIQQWMDLSFAVSPAHRAPITWGAVKAQ